MERNKLYDSSDVLAPRADARLANPLDRPIPLQVLHVSNSSISIHLFSINQLKGTT